MIVASLHTEHTHSTIFGLLQFLFIIKSLTATDRAVSCIVIKMNCIYLVSSIYYERLIIIRQQYAINAIELFSYARIGALSFKVETEKYMKKKENYFRIRN